MCKAVQGEQLVKSCESESRGVTLYMHFYTISPQTLNISKIYLHFIDMLCFVNGQLKAKHNL